MDLTIKAGAQRLLGPIYGLLRSWKNSDGIRLLTSFRLIPNNIFKRHWNAPYFVVELAGRQGLGGMLVTLVKILKYCDKRSLTPIVRFTNPLYASRANEDWFESILVMRPGSTSQIDRGRKLLPIIIRNEFNLLGLRVPARLELAEASRIFHKYLEFSTPVAQSCSSFLKDNQFSISVHYRGTDKMLEAASVDFEIMATKLDFLIRSAGIGGSIFLGTDSGKFSEYLHSKFPDINFVSFNLGQMLREDTPRHFSSMPGDQKAMEAAVNMLLFSKSVQCLRTSSYLSACSKIVNPKLRTTTVNNLYKGRLFPEAEIAAGERNYELANDLLMM